MGKSSKSIKEFLVSIIVPVYNEKKFLHPCIQSILNQTWENLELILVDDGSDDEIARECDKYTGLDHRVSVIHKKNEGLSAARITGLKHATGDWVMFVDDDDVVAINIVEELMKYARETVDIIAGGRIDCGEMEADLWNGWVGKREADYKIQQGRVICEEISEDKQKNIITPLWGKIYRKVFLNSMDLEKYRNKCPTIFFEDVLMTPILYYKARNICIIKAAYYAHREVPTSISRSAKLTAFYYEQIDSGNILLQFCKAKALKKLYPYELTLYMDSILRIYCLMGDDMDCYSRNRIREKILFFYKKYIMDYLKYANVGIVKKSAIFMFIYSKKLWVVLVRKFMFKI